MEQSYIFFIYYCLIFTEDYNTARVIDESNQNKPTTMCGTQFMVFIKPNQFFFSFRGYVALWGKVIKSFCSYSNFFYFCLIFRIQVTCSLLDASCIK
jgi:hypothetical protein